MTDLAAIQATLDASTYWPKWDSTWWHVTLRFEQGRLAEVPPGVLHALIATVGRDSLPFFPTDWGQIPAGMEPSRCCQCHCALGTIYQLAVAGGLDVDVLVPFARKWILENQLHDGGWNCDETTYAKTPPRSSLISTLPMLESLLVVPGGRTPAEDAALDRGAEYLIARKLFRSVSGGGQPIKPEWLHPIFPRFYEYDVLRGARFLARWALLRGRTLPEGTLDEVLAALETWAADGCKPRAWLHTEGTLMPHDWDAPVVRPAPTYPELDAVSDPTKPNPWLRAEWEGLQADLAKLA